jgi:hypothetical protein
VSELHLFNGFGRAIIRIPLGNLAQFVIGAASQIISICPVGIRIARQSVRHIACSFSQVGKKEGQTMKVQTVHMTDKMLRDAVIAQLDFEPEVNPAGIGVAAEDGVVTLSGSVDDYAQKVAAEKRAGS